MDDFLQSMEKMNISCVPMEESDALPLCINREENHRRKVRRERKFPPNMFVRLPYNVSLPLPPENAFCSLRIPTSGKNKVNIPFQPMTSVPVKTADTYFPIP